MRTAVRYVNVGLLDIMRQELAIIDGNRFAASRPERSSDDRRLSSRSFKVRTSALEGRVALVTGSSRGIGAEIARRMALAGAKDGPELLRQRGRRYRREGFQISASGGDAMLIAGDVSPTRDQARADSQGGSFGPVRAISTSS